MSDLLLFSIGVIITLATVAAVLLIGRSEAEDPALNRGLSDGDRPKASIEQFEGQGATP